MRLTPESLAEHRGWSAGDPRQLFEHCGDDAERAELGAAWSDVCPEEALSFAASSREEGAAMLAHVDRELDLAPLGRDVLRVEARGRVGLEQIAALPDSVLGKTRDLTVTRVGPDDGARFAEVVTAARFPALTRLDVGGQVAVADAALSLIGEHLTDFTYRAKGFDTEHVKKLASRPLSRVALFSLPEEAALPLLSMESLQSLRLDYCPFPHKHLKQLAKLPALRELALVSHGLYKATTKTLATLENIQALDLSWNETVDDASWARLGALTQLQRLTLNENRVGAKTLEALAPLPLQELSLYHAGISEAGALSTMTALEELDLTFTAPDADGWAAIGSLPRLRRLVLRGVRATGKQLEAVAGLASLRHLDVEKCELVGEDLAPLAKLSSLRQLNLDWNRSLDDSGMAPLEALPLRGLDVGSCKLTSAGLSRIAKIASLEWLNISGNGIDDVSPIAKLKNLRWLHTGKNPIGATAGAMGALSALVELYADECGLEDDFGDVVASLPNLRRFFVWGNALGDGIVAKMAHAPGLRIVNLVGNPFTDPGKRQLAEALPDCTFEW